jgi:predicted phage tail component-like protein
MPNGYKIGGRHIHEFLVEMTGKEVPITPPFSNQDETQGGRDGGWDFGVQYEPKIIPVDHYIWTPDRATTQAKLREMAGHLNPRKGAQELIFDDEPDKMYYARINEQINIEEVIKLYNDFRLTFICYDPFTYSAIEYSTQITGSGIVWTSGSHVSKPILVVDHKGGSATVTCTPPGGDPQSIVFTADTPPGTFTIDMKQGTVKMGSAGGDKYIESLQWIEMVYGNNAFTHTGNINSVTVKYRHTWF